MADTNKAAAQPVDTGNQEETMQDTKTNEEVSTTPEETNPLADLSARVAALSGRTTKAAMRELIDDLAMTCQGQAVEISKLEEQLKPSGPKHTAHSGANHLMTLPRHTGEGRTCPITGQLLKKKRMFSGYGADAKAKGIINALLDRDPRAETELAKAADPDRIREAAKLAEELGYGGDNPVKKPNPIFAELEGRQTA